MSTQLTCRFIVTIVSEAFAQALPGKGQQRKRG